jgi:hypothetical protein
MSPIIQGLWKIKGQGARLLLAARVAPRVPYIHDGRRGKARRPGAWDCARADWDCSAGKLGGKYVSSKVERRSLNCRVPYEGTESHDVSSRLLKHLNYVLEGWSGLGLLITYGRGPGRPGGFQCEAASCALPLAYARGAGTT